MTVWRYIAQRATTGELLDLEVPFLQQSELTWSLSAAGSFKGSVAPEIGKMTATDGRPLFEEWNTLLYAEADGEIRWGGIVISSEVNGGEWNIEAASFATYPSGMPYLGEFYASQTDPADIIRHIWDHLQTFTRGNLNVAVTGKTNVRVGSPSEAAASTATQAYTAAKAVYEAARDKYTALRAQATATSKELTQKRADKTAANAALTAAKKTKDPAQIQAAQTNVNAAQNAIDLWQAAYDDQDASAKAQAAVRDQAKAAMDSANAKKKTAVAAMKDDGGAYKLLWWEAPDCGSKIADLAKTTPLDYTEAHVWNADKTAITHTIQVQYPRAGRKRDDLAFVLGDNIIELPIPNSNGDEFANEVFGLGNGEGEAMVNTTTALDDGRLRRVNVFSSKGTKLVSTLQGQVRAELLKNLSNLTIDQIVVRDHPNAVIGSWALGDDILVQADVPWLGRLAIWHRIVAWSLKSDSTATLKLERSDSFSYGK